MRIFFSAILWFAVSILSRAAPVPAGAPDPAMDYPIRPVPFTAVRIEDTFWSARLETNRTRTIPCCFERCEETGRIANFAVAGKLAPGGFVGTPFNDSDVFKVVEAAAYSLATHPDPALDRYLDGLIAKFEAAQEPDGYLYTARTIDPKGRVNFFGPERWTRLRGSHELYNVGHLYEAAAAHFLATGKRSLLDIALRNAELIRRTFGPGPGQRRDPPGHEEIEIGLVKLARVTGDRRHLELARFFLETRGRANGRELYGPGAQDHQPVTEQREAVGHAVRACYLYAGMADVAALSGGDRAYVDALDLLWNDVTRAKFSLTGGVGARRSGEAFGAPFELPNAAVYNETCAAIAFALWNHRMFLVHGDGAAIDLLERALYNAILPGVSLSGDRFFYPNPLEHDGRTRFNQGQAERAPWFGCACCPTNIARYLAALPGLIYATRADELFVNLHIASSATLTLTHTALKVRMQTDAPWDGRVTLTLDPPRATRFALNLRVPGWARNRPVPTDLYRYAGPPGAHPRILVAGEPVAAPVERGFARIERVWNPGDSVTLELPMTPRRVIARPEVEATRHRYAVERGPLVYCAEEADNGPSLLKRVAGADPGLEVEERPGLLGGIRIVRLTPRDGGRPLILVPYHLWNHRGPGEMMVWVPERKIE